MMRNGIRTVFIACVMLTLTGHPVSAKMKLPLKVSKNHRYLVDQNNKPVLIVGDTAWSLIADLKEADVKTYLDDRQKRGFNSIIVNLIEQKFSTNPPKSRAGIAPFLKPGDFSTPNPKYFDWAAKVIQEANKRGILVWLCPAYLGWGGGDQGFFQEIRAGGKEKLRAYGTFLGKRFKGLPNIIWMVGGDYAMPPNHRWAATELATSIRAAGAKQLLTAHGGQQSATETVNNPKWLDINNTYSYKSNLYSDVRFDAQTKPIRPLVLIESIYENEHNSRPEQIRRQAYWAMTCGACGQFFGNNPIWHFEGPGLFEVKNDWRRELDSKGSCDMARLRLAFVQRPWHLLMPDLKNRIITKGVGRETATITTAATPDKKLAMSYIPSTGTKPREITIDASSFAGKIKVSWFNPTTSKMRNEKLFFPNRGQHTLKTPGDNGSGTNDWLLILEAEDGK